MSQNTSPLILPFDCEIINTYLKRDLEKAGYQVIRSFDLQRARAIPVCDCPHHGKAECNCQMIILLVYLSNGEPHTLNIHGRDGATHISWVEVLSEDEEVALFTIVKESLTQVKHAQESEISISI